MFPRPRTRNGRSLTRIRFGLIPVRSPLLRKSLRFPFLQVLRCFSSLRSPPQPMYSAPDDGASPPPGFPIRKSTDQSSLSSSPWLIAASRVLHRLSAPKHPPCTLRSLTPVSILSLFPTKPDSEIEDRRSSFSELGRRRRRPGSREFRRHVSIRISRRVRRESGSGAEKGGEALAPP